MSDTEMRWGTEIRDACARYGLPVGLIWAIVQVESGGNPWAWNPEPRYRWLWNIQTNTPFRQLLPSEINAETPPLDFPYIAGDRDQEWWGQQASFGLMQTMGAVARENGCAVLYLTELCKPWASIEFGCRHVKKLFQRHGNTDSVLAAYNTGRPDHPPGSAGKVYVRKIRALYRG